MGAKSNSLGVVLVAVIIWAAYGLGAYYIGCHADVLFASEPEPAPHSLFDDGWVMTALITQTDANATHIHAMTGAYHASSYEKAKQIATAAVRERYRPDDGYVLQSMSGLRLFCMLNSFLRGDETPEGPSCEFYLPNLTTGGSYAQRCDD